MRIEKIPLIANGEILIPGDKSISHRAVMISSLTRGKTEIRNFLSCRDTLTTLKAFKKLGVEINHIPEESRVIIRAKGKYFKPGLSLVSFHMSESGTTIRLIAGILSAQKFKSRLLTAVSLKKRPMKRIIAPLQMMGADISGKEKGTNQYPPLYIRPVREIKAIDYKLPVASAQVKSCLLLAGLYAKGKTKVLEPVKSRNHTELMLKTFGVNIESKGRSIVLDSSFLKTPGSIFIPSDFSSAAFFIVLCLLLNNSKMKIRNVSVNPTRTGLLKVLRRMGADIKLVNICKSGFEPYADILVKSSRLKGIKVRPDEVPCMIDELPLLFVAASFAKGKTHIQGLRELKVKETDRISSMEYNLKKMGVQFQMQPYQNKNGQTDYKVSITGTAKIKPVKVKTFSDHRTAMSMVVANLALNGPVYIDDSGCISKSFPEFIDIIKSLRVNP